MRVKSPDDRADGSNHFIFSFSFSIIYSISYYFPVREIAAPYSFERGKAATALTTRFFSFFPAMLAIAA
jgi:hypothetical protein